MYLTRRQTNKENDMKKHLAANKGTNGQAIYSRCAAISKGKGKVNRNNREAYQNIPQSHILSYSDLKEVPSEQVCAHCLDMGLQVRNRQRTERGLPKASHLFG
jgi:hypothetical protein